MRPRSIGARLTLWYAAILTAGLGLFGVLLYFSLRHQLLQEIDVELQGRAARFEAYFKTQIAEEPARRVRGELVEFCQALPPGSFISLEGDQGYRFRYPAESLDQAAARSWYQEFSLNGQKFHLQAAGSVAPVDHVLNLLRLLLWSFTPLVILFACACGAWLSRRALKPVQDIAAAALTIEDAGGRLPVPATRDELAYLSTVLNTMLEKIDRAVTTLSQFVADASHELRTPLSIILADAELALRRARSSESYRESLEQVAQEATRMTRLVENLLFLARSDGRLGQMPIEPVDLAAIAKQVQGEVLALADSRGIRVGLRVDDAQAVILANPDALRRLLLALLDNALKYTSPQGHVTIRVADTSSALELSVEDSGGGISAADLPFIFDRFYRADQSRNSNGHGLGLSIARTIAKAHAAEIEASSVEGQGSVFRVRFPARCRPQEIFS